MIVGKKAFMISGSGEVVCLDITDGKIGMEGKREKFSASAGNVGDLRMSLGY